MKIIINESWNYQLIKDAEQYKLSVLCGTVALYEIEYVLNFTNSSLFFCSIANSFIFNYTIKWSFLKELFKIELIIFVS